MNEQMIKDLLNQGTQVYQQGISYVLISNIFGVIIGLILASFWFFRKKFCSLFGEDAEIAIIFVFVVILLGVISTIGFSYELAQFHINPKFYLLKTLLSK